MQKSTGKKKYQYQKNEFSDGQIEDEIRDEIHRIRQRTNFNEVEKIEAIDQLYRKRKEEKKMKKMMQRGNQKRNYSFDKKNDNQSQSEQPGQINQHPPNSNQPLLFSSTDHPHISINELGQLIRQITLTRKQIIDLLDSRKFEDLVKGCFVRYLTDSISKKDSYIIAQIIGITQGKKQYILPTASNTKTRLNLKLQQTSQKIVQLPITMVSNQSKQKGSLQITQWLHANGSKIPKQKQLRDKLQQHNRLLTQQLSSQQIDKNIENRALAMSKGEIPASQDIQNLIDFIIQKIDNYQAQQQQQIGKRSNQALKLIQIRRRKYQYSQIKQKLDEKKKQWQQKNQQKQGQRLNKQQGRILNKNVMLKLQQKRQDIIKEKTKLKQMMLGTAEGVDKIRINLMEIHNKFDLDIQ